MLFLYKDDIDSYRYAVGKFCFLKLFNEFRLVENYKHSNCMKVAYGDSKIVVSLFQMPDAMNGIEKEDEIRVYYQQTGYTKAINSAKKKQNEKNEIFLLDDDFDNMYEEKFEQAIKDPESLLDESKDLHILFEELIHENIEIEDAESCFKYYAKDTICKKKYNVVDGNISFSDPNRFNDPFDVNCFFF